MASIEQLKEQVDLHTLAGYLGLKRQGSDGNYHSPAHTDKSASLSVYNDGKAWKDHSTGDGGSCIDLVMYADDEIEDVGQAVRKLHDLFNIPMDEYKKNEPDRKLTLPELIERRSFNPEDLNLAANYLIEERGLTEEVVTKAIARRSVGFNTYTSDTKSPGERFYGGPAVTFFTRTMNPGHVVAADMRYLDPELNGGLKTQCQGEKNGFLWFSDFNKLKSAKRVYVVESPINALSVDVCGLPGTATVATRGASNVGGFDWHFLQGKQVVLCMDNDEPNERTGYCPGALAAWQIHEQLTALNISSFMVDQSEWECNDVNDFLREQGDLELKVALQKYDQWAIAGLRGDDKGKGRSRIFLPSHDFAQYWRYRVKEDFTRMITKRTETDDGTQDDYGDVCGFRVAAISRVTVAGSTATMSGEQDAQPNVLFSVSVQTPRHGHKLIRRVFEDERLHNVDQWRKFGPVYSQTGFLRMLNILERGADIGARHAVNFVGLAWREGNLIVNEGPDCYFTEPDKQCPYHNLVFPSGPRNDARRVLLAYQDTFKDNAAAMPLVWALGSHLKAFLGFWPHMVMQADKGSGKTTLLLRLSRTIAFTLFSNESLKTTFRILTSISHTSHPVGWEEMSANTQKVIDDAVSALQQSYQYTSTKRGSDMTEYLLSAPVLLAGEDVPVKSLTGKLVRTDLSGKMGPMMPEDLSRFPVREWLQFLTGLSRDQVRTVHAKALEYIRQHSRSSGEDNGASRMEGNYAALLTSWRLLCEFAGLDRDQGDFIGDCIAEMNRHIADTSGDREPWVWILETMLNEIASNHYKMPYTWSDVKDKAHGTGERETCLVIRPSQIMHHISTSVWLRDLWNMLPVKSPTVLKKQIIKSGVVVDEDIERTIGGRREAHMMALSVDRIAKYGLHASPSELTSV